MGSQAPTIVPTRPVSTQPTPSDSQATFPMFPCAAVTADRTEPKVTNGSPDSGMKAYPQPPSPEGVHRRHHAQAHPHAHFRTHSHNGSASHPYPSAHGASTHQQPTIAARLAALNDRTHEYMAVHRDLRSYLPPILSRFLGWRPPTATPPYDPLPFPPFSWLRHIPLKYEVWILSTIGAFVGIALIEIVMGTAFADKDVPLIIASFGASAVLTYGAVDSPLAQPRHLVGGQVLCAIVGVAVTRLFRHAAAYMLTDTTVTGELGNVVWLNGALCMALALLVMQVTKTVHPPAGATALIAAVQPSAVHLSWRYVYLVIIQVFLMMGWGMIINNVGRRKYPTYWLSSERVYVRDPRDGVTRVMTQDDLMMGAEEGRNAGFDLMTRVMSSPSPDIERATPPLDAEVGSNCSWHEKHAREREAHR